MDVAAAKRIRSYERVRALRKASARRNLVLCHHEIKHKHWKRGDDNHTKVRSICRDYELKNMTNCHIRRFEGKQFDLY